MVTVRPQRLFSHGNTLEPTVLPVVLQIHPSFFGPLMSHRNLEVFSSISLQDFIDVSLVCTESDS